MKAVTRAERVVEKLVKETEAAGRESVTIRLDTLKSLLADIKKPDARFREDGSKLNKRKAKK